MHDDKTASDYNLEVMVFSILCIVENSKGF
jgi:hypothetical protein